MATRKWKRRLLLAAISLLACLLALELGYRALLFSDAAIARSWRRPGRYADPFAEDDYWKLYELLGGEHRPPAAPHPVLGWVGQFDRETYEHRDAPSVGGRRPVLLYGDSFAAGSPGAEDLAAQMNADPGFHAAHHVLDYGVGGYGLDQVVMLTELTLDHHPRPFVVFSFMTLDIDRCVLSVRVGQKPRFTIRDGRLVPPANAIDPDPERFFAENPPDIRSYLWRRLARSMDPEAAARATEPEKRQLALLLLRRVANDLRRRDVDHVFVVFHVHWPQVSPLDVEGWREEVIREALADAPTVWVRDLLPRDDPDFDPSAWFLDDGHPTTKHYRLLAEVLKARIAGR